MKSNHVISVVMPAHNYGKFISESIDSVLAQTMPDFELIVINDGSTDESGEIAHSYLDKRVKVIDFPENRGCYPARNAGMRVASGKYICVMDADDVCLPERLEKQYQFMEENTEYGLIGGAYQIYNSYQPLFKETDFESIKLLLLSFCYLRHPTCMIRTSVFQKYNLYYNESYTYASDYDWQVRASSFFPITIINHPLLLHRTHDQQISTSKINAQGFFANQIRIHQLSFLGIAPTEIEKELHIRFIKRIDIDPFEERKIDQWIERLLEGNRRTRYYSQEKLYSFLQAYRYKFFFQNP